MTHVSPKPSGRRIRIRRRIGNTRRLGPSPLGALIAVVACVAVALIAASAASAATYCNTYLVGDGASCSSGWNYWFATDVTKDPHYEWLGMHNSAGVDKHVDTSGTYKYTDKNILGMGGYMHAYVIKKSSGSAYNHADVCTC